MAFSTNEYKQYYLLSKNSAWAQPCAKCYHENESEKV